MKKRMRYYIRQGWEIITLPVASIDEPDRSYHSVRFWCEKNFKKEEWAGSLYGTSDGSRFAFKNPADATLFTLKWL